MASGKMGDWGKYGFEKLGILSHFCPSFLSLWKLFLHFSF